MPPDDHIAQRCGGQHHDHGQRQSFLKRDQHAAVLQRVEERAHDVQPDHERRHGEDHQRRFTAQPCAARLLRRPS